MSADLSPTFQHTHSGWAPFLRAVSCAALLSLFLTNAAAVKPARAQSSDTFGQTLERVGEDYAALYAQPVVDAVGANLNSGLFHKAGVGDGLIPGVDLYLGVKTFGTLVPDADHSLSLSYAASESITLPDGTQCTSRDAIQYEIDEAPTAFGSSDPGRVTASGVFECDNGTVVDSSATLNLLPGVLDSGVAPMAVMQAGIGLPLTGTHVSLRYLPRLRYKDYGSIRLAGGGLHQEIGRFLPQLPFDLSVQGFYQSITITEELRGEESKFITASSFASGVSASKTLSVVTFYGGLQVERTTADLNYTFDPGGSFDPQSIDLDMTGANTFRVLAGVSAGLGPVVLNADFSQGQRSILSAGFGFSL